MGERPWWLQLTGTPPSRSNRPSSPTPVRRGWYMDPWGHHRSRFWDGRQWTTRVSDGGRPFRETNPKSSRFARLPGIASLPRRGFATLIDAVPLGTVNVPAYLLLGHSAVTIVIAIAAGAAYLIPLIAIYGQTLGDRLVGIQVVEQDDGNLPGWRRSVLRYLASDGIVQLVGNIYPSAFGWGFIVIVGVALFDSRRRGFHDRAGGVLVVEVPSNRP